MEAASSRLGARLARPAALIYLAFLAVWGLNYRRVSMTDRLLLDRAGSAGRDRGRLAAPRSATECAALSGPRRRVADSAVARTRFATRSSGPQRLSDAPAAVPGRIKWSLLGPYFRWASVDGMINPFGLEAIANPDLLPFERPFVAAHEWAHLAGYADESEASFVGFLTCVRAATPGRIQRLAVPLLADQLRGGVRRSTRASRRRSRTVLARTSRQSRERLRRGQVPDAPGRGMARVRPVPESEPRRRGCAQLRARSHAPVARAIRGGLDAGQARRRWPIADIITRTIRPAAARRSRSWTAAPSP